MKKRVNFVSIDFILRLFTFLTFFVWLVIGDIYLPPKPPLPALAAGRTGRRLVIDTIVCENFKSYGGTTTLGPFYKCFNAIVGPNGSGKSNVIDAIVFIFGFRANKIRTKKLSSLIHKSESLPDCKHARVRVNFVMIDDLVCYIYLFYCNKYSFLFI